MTVAIAWIGKRPDGREHLYLASDSRVTGGHTMDACPKILTLPRSDCALCFAGSTAAAYPLMLQVANAIAAHLPSRNRTMDLARLKAHVLRVCSDLIGRFRGAAVPFENREVQFLLAGFSWLTNDFRIWTIEYSARQMKFVAHEARSFHARLRKAAFVGDHGTALRSLVMGELRQSEGPPWNVEPLRVLAGMLLNAPSEGTIGGPPQLVRIARHMNTRSFCVRWKDQDTVFGRPLFQYENVDYRVINPMNGAITMPPPFGRGRRAAGEPQDPADSGAPERLTPSVE